MSVQTKKRIRMAITYIVCLAVLIITLFPIYWMFLVSFRNRIEIFDKPKLYQTTFFTENYTKPFVNGACRRYLWNSIVIATCNTAIVTVCAVLATYAFSRFPIAGYHHLFFWTITNRMAPPAAFLLPLYLIFTIIGKTTGIRMLDSRWGLILLYCVFNLPFAIWLLKGMIDAIPQALDEAALIDGAGTFQVLRYIIIPTAKPGIAVAAILTWIFSWNEYIFASTLTSVDARTITTGLAGFVTVVGVEWGQMAAVSVVSLLPAIVFLGYIQKYIITGLTFGAVKE
jgi:ABC-type glycerol-3-phosphate transport system permease component